MWVIMCCADTTIVHMHGLIYELSLKYPVEDYTLDNSAGDTERKVHKV